MPWTKDTLRETEQKALDIMTHNLVMGKTQAGTKQKLRRILHQLAYDAWRRGLQSKTGGAENMGIDLSLINPEQEDK